MIKTILKNKKTFFKYLFIVMLSLSMVIFLISSFVQYRLNESRKAELLIVNKDWST